MAFGPLTDLLNDLVRSQDIAKRASAQCEWEKDPSIPGRTAWRISGHSRECVQRAIDTRMRYVEREGGAANFLGPYRDGDGYVAIGETIITSGVEA